MSMKRLAAGGLGLFVVLVAAVFIYFNFIRDDAPEEFTLTGTSAEDGDTASDDPATGDPATGDTPGTADSDTAADSDEMPASEDDPDDGTDADSTEDDESAAGDGTADGGSLDGMWTVAPGSEAGYRVVEDLRGIQDFEAVGRTSDVTGSVEIEGTAVTGGSFEVDVASIESDDGRRDTEFRGFAVMNAPEFPTATLTLTEPIDFGTVPAPGTPVSATATGELTLRGETNPVTFPVDAQLLDGQIEIVGSIDVLFSDYGIANPSNAFVSVRDEGKVEVRLLLSKS